MTYTGTVSPGGPPHVRELAGLTITELNPHHAAAVPGSLERFAAAVGERLA